MSDFEKSMMRSEAKGFPHLFKELKSFFYLYNRPYFMLSNPFRNTLNSLSAMNIACMKEQKGNHF